MNDYTIISSKESADEFFFNLNLVCERGEFFSTIPVEDFSFSNLIATKRLVVLTNRSLSLVNSILDSLLIDSKKIIEIAELHDELDKY